MTPQERADEFLSVWRRIREAHPHLTIDQRGDLMDRLFAEERFFRAVNKINTDIGAMRDRPFLRGTEGS